MNRRKMMLGTSGTLFALAATNATNSAPADVSDSEAIESAKAIIQDHEAKFRDGNLDRIMLNVSNEIILFAPGAKLVEGVESFRELYQPMLDMGTWDFVHHYAGADVQGEAVILYGVSKGTLTPTDEEPSRFENNFLLVLKPEDGQYKVWRGAFAPNS
jgi:ketosteroid isomerase-like protein